MKRHVTRGLIVALLGVPVLLFTAIPAQAFTFSGDCSGNLNGERDAYFNADNGDFVGYGVWQWSYSSSTGKTTYYLWAVDEKTNDPASMTAQVVTSAGGTITYENQSNYHITYGVTKYRFVWNGYPTTWFSPSSCSAAS